MSKKLIAKQSKEMVFSRMNFNANEIRLLLSVVAQIDSFKGHIEPITVTLEEMSDLYRKKLRSRDLKILLDKLNQHFWLKIEKKQVQTSIFKEIYIEDGTSDITFYFSERMEQHLIKFKENKVQFIKTNIRNIAPLKSVYSIRIYQFLREKLNINEKFNKNDKLVLELEDLKEMLMTPKSYEDFSLFRQYVLTPALEQINEFTDISFTYETITKGKKVIGIEFDIKTNVLKEQRIKYEAKKAFKIEK